MWATLLSRTTPENGVSEMTGLSPGAAAPSGWRIAQAPDGRLDIFDEHGMLRHSGTPIEIAHHLASYLCAGRIGENLQPASDTDLLQLFISHNWLLLAENKRLHTHVRHQRLHAVTQEDFSSAAVSFRESASCNCGKCFEVVLAGSVVLRDRLTLEEAEKYLDKCSRAVTKLFVTIAPCLRDELIGELKFAGMDKAAALLRHNSQPQNTSGENQSKRKAG
jgi:hypothetical protein